MREMRDCGIEWINNIPKNWNVTKLKYIVDCLDGQRVPVDASLRTSGPYPYWGAGSIQDYVDDYIFDEELVLLGEDGSPFFDPYRPVAFIVNEKIWVNNHIHVLRVKSIFNSHYLMYSLNSVDYNQYINGSILNKLTQGNMNNIVICYPPLKEQQLIAAYLDRKCADIDALTADIETQIESLEQYKRSVITEAVTKGRDPDAEMKDSGVEFIGNIPEHWEIRRIKTLGTSRNGLTFSPADLCDERDGVLVLRASNVEDGDIVLNDNIYVRTKIPSELMVKEEDILICSRNGSIKLIGKNALIPPNISATFGAFMMIYRTGFSKYLYYILNSSIFDYYLGSFITSTINQLTKSNFGNMKIPFCKNQAERDEIVNYLDYKCAEIDDIIASKSTQLEVLAGYKRSLIYEYVTGKKEVPTK